MEPVERFAELVRMPEARLDLGEAALTIAAGGEPGLAVPRWLGELDRLAEGLDGLADLRRRLFDELGYTCNTDDYYDPSNSFLHRVIERRVGIPITLSVLVIEVGRRAGVELEGVGMPGHFLLRLPGTDVYLDPFHGGELLDERGCEAHFRAVSGAHPQIDFGSHLLPTASIHEILSRMLANLRGIYLRRGSAADLEWVLRMRLELPEVPSSEVGELGRVLAAQGKFLEGAVMLERRAPAHPHLSGTLRATARALRARLN
ncbi:MAG: transglutaminase-like domain-containing protein [Actinomycetota bacterium]|nr:transglutaminase-like domain-containing protein [Actinomycetota bacterium]